MFEVKLLGFGKDAKKTGLAIARALSGWVQASVVDIIAPSATVLNVAADPSPFVRISGRADEDEYLQQIADRISGLGLRIKIWHVTGYTYMPPVSESFAEVQSGVLANIESILNGGPDASSDQGEALTADADAGDDAVMPTAPQANGQPHIFASAQSN